MEIIYPKLAAELKSRKIKLKDVEALLGISAKSHSTAGLQWRR